MSGLRVGQCRVKGGQGGGFPLSLSATTPYVEVNSSLDALSRETQYKTMMRHTPTRGRKPERVDSVGYQTPHQGDIEGVCTQYF